jgi:cytochrome c oxidase subunit II
MERRSILSLTLLAALLALPLASAAESAELYPTPKTDVARSVQSLFNTTLAIAMVVFIGVEALLFYIVWKFRHNKTVPAGETHRGHTKAEIVWTVIPAVILLGLGSVSAVTLFDIDTVPDDVDFGVRVEASQFIWKFTYPDNTSTFNDLRVESGNTVRLDLVSRDVEHQLFIPNFAIKISAIPGRTNHQWFIAPEPGHYPIECSMYCGFGHHEMGAADNAGSIGVTVFAQGTQALPYGAPPKTPTPATPTLPTP